MPEEKLQPCENWRQFYLLWVKVVFTASLGWADAVGFILGILIPLIQKIFPSMQESKLEPLAWEIPLAVFCLVGAGRMFLAPYLIYRDRHLSAKQKESELTQSLQDRDNQIHTINQKPKRSASEQHDYENVKRALDVVKEKGKTALLFLRAQGSLTFCAPGSGYYPTPPQGLTVNDLLWVYRHCASEGIISVERNIGATKETFTVAPHMSNALNDALFED